MSVIFEAAFKDSPGRCEARPGYKAAGRKFNSPGLGRVFCVRGPGLKEVRISKAPQVREGGLILTRLTALLSCVVI